MAFSGNPYLRMSADRASIFALQGTLAKQRCPGSSHSISHPLGHGLGQLFAASQKSDPQKK